MTVDEVSDAINNAPKGEAVKTFRRLIRKISDREERKLVRPDLEEMAILIDESP